MQSLNYTSREYQPLLLLYKTLKVAKSTVYDTIKRYKELGKNKRPPENWSTKNGAYSKEN